MTSVLSVFPKAVVSGARYDILIHELIDVPKKARSLYSGGGQRALN